MENPNLIDQLRSRIEAQHQEALKALEVLAKYLSSTNDGATVPVVVTTSHEVEHFRPKGMSNRELVLHTLQALRSATVDELSRATGLTKTKIRGVLYAPSLKNRFNTHVSGGIATYESVESKP